MFGKAKIIKEGSLAHFRTKGIIPSGIRHAQGKWMSKVCKRLEVDYVQPWGNHSGVFVHDPVNGCMCIGEATASGNVLTPLRRYKKMIDAGDVEMRIYWPKGASIEDGHKAGHNWRMKCEGRGYDYLAYVRFIIKCYLFNWSMSDNKFLKRIGDRQIGHRHRFYCTEGQKQAWLFDGGYDIYEDESPAPMHTEIAAGELPSLSGHPITLDRIS